LDIGVKTMAEKKIKVGVFGAARGETMVSILSRHPDAELTAICDRAKPMLERCKNTAEKFGAKITTYENFEQFFQHDMDAVVLANYATEHAEYAIKFLDSGRHVVSELLSCQTLAEGVALVEAVERSGKVYSYAENCCYLRSTLEMRKIYRRGDLGEFLHGEGEYVHDCESIWPYITYGERNHWRNWMHSTFYCTHAIGPIVTITGTRPVRLTAYETLNYNKRRYGSLGADGSVIVCQMSNDATAVFLPANLFKRQPESIWFAIYGSKGMAETDRWGECSNIINVFIEGSELSETEIRYRPRFPEETELSRKISGHGGADFYTMHYFLKAIQDAPGKENIIDVYQAIDMTLPGILGYKSIWEGNKPIDVPDFRIKEVRDRFRNDNWSVDPKFAGPGQPDRSYSREKIEVPDSVYEEQAAKWREYLQNS